MRQTLLWYNILIMTRMTYPVTLVEICCAYKLHACICTMGARRGRGRRNLGRFPPGIWKCWRHMLCPYKIPWALASNPPKWCLKRGNKSWKFSFDPIRRAEKLGYFCQFMRYSPSPLEKFLRAPMMCTQVTEARVPWEWWIWSKYMDQCTLVRHCANCISSHMELLCACLSYAEL